MFKLMKNETQKEKSAIHKAKDFFTEEDLEIVNKHLKNSPNIEFNFQALGEVVKLTTQAQTILIKNNIPFRVIVDYYENKEESLLPFSKKDQEFMDGALEHFVNFGLQRYFGLV